MSDERDCFARAGGVSRPRPVNDPTLRAFLDNLARQWAQAAERVRAGALQPGRDDPEWKPGYNWIDLSVEKEGQKRLLKVRLWVRMHEVSQFQAIHDPDDKEIWENCFELAAWPSAAATAPPQVRTDTVQVLENPMATAGAPPITVRSVTIKLFKLKEHEQRRIIARCELDRPGDRELKDYELAVNAVRRSQQEGTLQRFNDLIDEMLARQEGA
jgi:hypothetical protein